MGVGIVGKSQFPYALHTLIASTAGKLFSQTEYMHWRTQATISIPYLSTLKQENRSWMVFCSLKIFNAVSLASHRFHISVTEMRLDSDYTEYSRSETKISTIYEVGPRSGIIESRNTCFYEHLFLLINHSTHATFILRQIHFGARCVFSQQRT